MIYQRKLFSFLILVGFLTSMPLQAQEERWYEIEVLAFSQATAKAYESEKWPIDLQPSLPPEAVTVLQTSATSLRNRDSGEGMQMPVAFEDISLEEYQFQKIREKIILTENLDLLIHKAWRQPVYQSQNGTPVLLDDEDSDNAYQEFSRNELVVSLEPEVTQEDLPDNTQFANSENSNIDPRENISLDWSPDTMTGEEIPEELTSFSLRQPWGPEELRIYGTVTLKWSRFLHLEFDMYFRTRKPETAADEATASVDFPIENGNATPITQTDTNNRFLSSLELEPVDFRLNESRRVKTKKIYYFDHPLFGIVAMVTPVDLPEVEEFANMR